MPVPAPTTARTLAHAQGPPQAPTHVPALELFAVSNADARPRAPTGPTSVPAPGPTPARTPVPPLSLAKSLQYVLPKLYMIFIFYSSLSRPLEKKCGWPAQILHECSMEYSNARWT